MSQSELRKGRHGIALANCLKNEPFLHFLNMRETDRQTEIEIEIEILLAKPVSSSSSK